MISPRSRYKEIIAEQQLTPDSAQLDAIAKLDALHRELKVKDQLQFQRNNFLVLY